VTKPLSLSMTASRMVCCGFKIRLVRFGLVAPRPGKSKSIVCAAEAVLPAFTGFSQAGHLQIAAMHGEGAAEDLVS
jgi:hypothetical protein